MAFHKRRGRPPFPRVSFEPAFRARLSTTQVKHVQQVGQWPQFSALSCLLHQKHLPASPVTLGRIYLVADALNFKREDVPPGGVPMNPANPDTDELAQLRAQNALLLRALQRSNREREELARQLAALQPAPAPDVSSPTPTEDVR